MTFKAAVTPTLTPDAQRLVDIYDQTPGSSGPYCNPAGLACVVNQLATDMLKADPVHSFELVRLLKAAAFQLRGQIP